MRLRDIRKLLDGNIAQVPMRIQGVNTNVVDFVNRASVRRALKAIGPIPFFTDRIEKLFEDVAFTSESSVLPAGKEGVVLTETQKIHSEGRTILEFLNLLLPDDPEGFFTVRLPSSDDLAGGVAKRFESLQRAFEQPVYRVFAQPLKITLVEPGSILVELGLYLQSAGTVAAGTFSANQILAFIGKLVSLGTEKAKLEQERAKAKQELEKTKQESEKTKQEEAKTQQALLALRQAENAAKAADLKVEAHNLTIESSIPNMVAQANDPNDAQPTVLRAVDEIAAMYAENTRFLLQLDAPDEVRREFPIEAIASTENASFQLQSATKGLLTK